VKFGTRELHKITLSSCQFPENRAVKGTFYVEGQNQLHHSLYVFHLISTKISTEVMSKTFDKWLCLLWKSAKWDIYIYIAYIMVWMNWCCCFAHWLQYLCEIRHEKSAQNGVDYLWVSCIYTHGRQYICFVPTLHEYRKIGTFSAAELTCYWKKHALHV
jgi:hypothetical protein